VTSLQFLEKLSAWSKNTIPDINSFSLIVHERQYIATRIPYHSAGTNKSSTAIGLYFNPQEKMTHTTPTFFSL
jgi:hypothetical protein